jgi:thiol-disulfide isomerase/thioredoxin
MRFCSTLFILFLCLGLIDAQENITVTNFEGIDNKIKSDTQTIVVYNFWATWCKPCVEELPLFQTIPSSLDGFPIKVVLVSLDFRSQLESRLIPFVAKKNIQQEVLLLDAGNPNIWIDQIDTNWSGSIPATLFTYGKKRKFVERSYECLEEILEDIHLLIQQ